jgi:RNase P subunit RPR2
MKRAKIVVSTVAVLCPDCGEDIPETTYGSLVWEASQISDTIVTCACGSQVRVVLPKALQ